MPIFDPNISSKNLQDFMKYLKKTGQYVDKTSEGFDDLSKSAKEVSQGLSEIKLITGGLNKLLSQSSAAKYIKSLKDIKFAASNVAEFSRQVSEMTKVISSAEKKVISFGSESSREIVNMTNKINLSKTAVMKFSEYQRQLAGFKVKMGELGDSFKVLGKNVGKSLSQKDADDAIDSLKSQLVSLMGQVKDTKIESLYTKLENLENLDLKSLPQVFYQIQKEIKNIPIDELPIIAQKAIKNMEKTFSTFKPDFDVSGMVDTLEEIEKQDAFQTLLKDNKALEGSFNDFKETLKDPSNFDAIQASMDTFNEFFENSNEVYVLQFRDSMDKIKEEVDKFENDINDLDRVLERPRQFTLMMGTSAKQIDNFINEVKEDLFNFNLEGFVPPEEIFNLEQIKSIGENITVLQGMMLSDLKDIEDSTDSLEEKNRKILVTQQKYTKEISKQGKDFKKMSKDINMKRKALKEIAEWDPSPGVTKWVGGMRKAQILLLSMNTGVKVLDKGIKGLATTIGALAGVVAVMAIPVALIAGLFEAFKWFQSINTEVAGWHKELASTGMLIGKNDTELLKLSKSSHNLAGIFGALGKTEFSITRKELVETMGDFEQAGIATRNLDKAMLGVATTAVGAESSMVGATNIVKTFSSELGMSTKDVTNLMGTMHYEFNSSMQGIKEGLTGIADALVKSSMSSVKFMGILQTATAGTALFQDQVEELARVISKLSKDGKMSGKGIEGVAKASTNLLKSPMEIFKVLALAGGNAQKDFEKEYDANVSALENNLALRKKELAKEKDIGKQKKMQADIDKDTHRISYLKSAKTYEQKVFAAEAAGPELGVGMLKNIIQSFRKEGVDKNSILLKSLTETLGETGEVIRNAIITGDDKALNAFFGIKEAITKKPKDKEKMFKGFQEKAIGKSFWEESQFENFQKAIEGMAKEDLNTFIMANTYDVMRAIETAVRLSYNLAAKLTPIIMKNLPPILKFINDLVDIFKPQENSPAQTMIPTTTAAERSGKKDTREKTIESLEKIQSANKKTYDYDSLVKQMKGFYLDPEKMSAQELEKDINRREALAKTKGTPPPHKMFREFLQIKKMDQRIKEEKEILEDEKKQGKKSEKIATYAVDKKPVPPQTLPTEEIPPPQLLDPFAKKAAPDLKVTPKWFTKEFIKKIQDKYEIKVKDDWKKMSEKEKKSVYTLWEQQKVPTSEASYTPPVLEPSPPITPPISVPTNTGGTSPGVGIDTTTATPPATSGNVYNFNFNSANEEFLQKVKNIVMQVINDPKNKIVKP